MARSVLPHAAWAIVIAVQAPGPTAFSQTSQEDLTTYACTDVVLVGRVMEGNDLGRLEHPTI